MNINVGRLLTLYSLYKLSGPGLVVIWLSLIGWYIEGTLGWFALLLYIVLLIALAFVLMHVLIDQINKKSKFFGQKPLDYD